MTDNLANISNSGLNNKGTNEFGSSSHNGNDGSSNNNGGNGRSVIKKILKAIAIIILIIAIAFAGLMAFISLTEYKPETVERVAINGKAAYEVSRGKALKVMTWNIGYGALGDNADFFMDGGTHVKTSGKQRIKENIKAVSREIDEVSPDIAMLQEVDKDSTRSEHIDQVSRIGAAAGDYENSFARNFKAAIVPYPLPPIGKVDSGVMTLSKFKAGGASRVSLPVSFKWPVRTINLKRCLLVNRAKVNGSDKELVYINLHLEAYDNGEGKKAQTEALNKLLKEESDKGNYVIACGDFNQTFNNVYIGNYPVHKGLWKPGKIDISEYDSSLNFVMDGTHPTCRSLDKPLKGADKSKFQFYVIDGMIYSSNIEMKSCKTQDLGFKHSDHNPVVAEIRLK